MAFINLLLAVLEALPILDKWFQEASLAYAKQQTEKGNEDFAKALAVATTEKKTTDLQSSIGSNLPK